MKKNASITLGSWYSGAIDGFAYAATQLGINVLYHVESDKRAYKYLRKNYPGVPICRYDGYESVKSLPEVTILAGGDPCQPHSTAGLQRGRNDPRHRWPFMLRGIKNSRPAWVINENVVGSVSTLALDQKITDLEEAGYTCQAFSIGAVAVDAWHKRQRIFLVAHSDAHRRPQSLCDHVDYLQKKYWQAKPLGASGHPFLQFQESIREPAVFPVADGIPDHIFRLEAAGNSIVPQIPLILLELIQHIEMHYGR